MQELWLNLIIHELEFAMANPRENKAGIAFKALALFSRVQEQLVTAWDVLSTMTPSDCLILSRYAGTGLGLPSPTSIGWWKSCWGQGPAHVAAAQAPGGNP